MKRFVRRQLQQRGLELVHSPTAIDFLRSRDVDLVLDVGANSGQYVQTLRVLGYMGRVRSFEPVSSAYRALLKASAGDRSWEITQAAVGAAAGSVAINVSRNTVFSSIKPTTEVARQLDSNSEAVGVEQVAMTTIDDAMRDEPARNIFMKIDTQGYEREVLVGASKFLERCVGLQLELPIEQLYEDVWSIDEALDFVRGAGFVPAQVRFATARGGDTASAMEFDWVFRRQTPVVNA